MDRTKDLSQMFVSISEVFITRFGHADSLDSGVSPMFVSAVSKRLEKGLKLRQPRYQVEDSENLYGTRYLHFCGVLSFEVWQTFKSLRARPPQKFDNDDHDQAQATHLWAQ